MFNFNEDLDRRVLRPVATAYSDVVPQPVRRGVSQLLRQLRRCLVGDQQHAAGQVRARLRGRDPGRHEHAVRPVRRPRRRLRDGPRPPLRRLRPDARAATASAPVPTSCCRCSARRPCATRRRCRSTAWRRRPRFFDGTGTQVGLTVLQIVNTRAEPARRDARDRRHLARQVHVRSRRLSAAAAQPDLRRRRRPRRHRRRKRRPRPRRARRQATSRRRLLPTAASAPPAAAGVVVTALRLPGRSCEPAPAVVRCRTRRVPCSQQGSRTSRTLSLLHRGKNDVHDSNDRLARRRDALRFAAVGVQAQAKAPEVLIKEVSTDVLDAVKADKTIQAGDRAQGDRAGRPEGDAVRRLPAHDRRPRSAATGARRRRSSRSVCRTSSSCCSCARIRARCRR